MFGIAGLLLRIKIVVNALVPGFNDQLVLVGQESQSDGWVARELPRRSQGVGHQLAHQHGRIVYEM